MKQFFRENYKVIICVCILLGLLAISLAVSPKSPQGRPSQNNPNCLEAGTGQENRAVFDTISYIYTYAGDTKEQFDANCKEVWSILAEYHQLFDIYHEYSGINNLCTLNKNAGGEALEVSPKLIDFLLYAKELYDLTNGEMNIMMGAVLVPWHDARENNSFKGYYCEYCHKFSSTRIVTDGKCPKPDPDYPNDDKKKCGRPVFPFEDVLAEKSQHISFDALEIDTVNNTVRIADKDARIDVGALGKGYATELAAKHLENKGVNSYVLNIGGNIRIIGTKPDGSGWPTGIKNPKYYDSPNQQCADFGHYDANKDSKCDACDETQFVEKIIISNVSCVTSGDYERKFIQDNKKYHHIIDKDTLMPAEYFSSITILTKDSGLADCLSTALFCMSYEEGLALVEKIGNVEVLWVYSDGRTEMTQGFEALLMD